MFTDPIADYVTRIRNASRVGNESVRIPYSKMKKEISQLLVKKEFIASMQVDDTTGKIKDKALVLMFRTDRPALQLKRISKPGQRIYLRANDIKSVKSGLGLSVISTSRGIICNNDAHKMHIGGEILFSIY